MIRAKICCISSQFEVDTAISMGASALGFVANMPSGPGVIPEKLIAQLARRVPPGIATFLLTSAVNAEAIIAQQRRCRTNTIQICDRVEPEVHEQLRSELPGIGLVQVVHVAGEESLSEALSVAGAVDAILLDSGNQNQSVKELGGTGRTHNWTISAEIVRQVSVPVYLAGGLTPDNVAEAVETVKPFGVDLCSGVRSEGRLDPAKLSSFMEALAAAPFY